MLILYNKRIWNILSRFDSLLISYNQFSNYYYNQIKLYSNYCIVNKKNKMIWVDQMMNLSNIWTNWTNRERTETFPMDCLDYLNIPRSIHGAELTVTDSWTAIQPRLKYIHCLYRDKSITQPYITFIWPLFMTNSQPLSCSPGVFRLSTPLWSARICRIIFWRNAKERVTLPSVPPNHNKWLFHYTNFKFHCDD